jgi:hypothetical protein
MLTINLLGDTLNAFLLRDWRTLIGVPIAGLMMDICSDSVDSW